MSAKIRTALVCVAGFAFVVCISLAQSVPQLINYQGRLTDSAGRPPADGTTVDLTFSFYGVESGSTPLYLTVLQEDVVVNKGIYNVLIGSGTITPGTESILSSVFQKHQNIWMGVKVDSNPEMSPRSRITNVPFAEKANTVNTYWLDAYMASSDYDGDGYTKLKDGGTDCNDGDALINPGASERCDDGIDNDCDGKIDGDDDDAAANVSITSPEDGATLSSTQYTVSGTADLDVFTVIVTSNQGHNESSPVVGGNWSVLLTGVTVPSLVVTAQGVDSCGNTGCDVVSLFESDPCGINPEGEVELPSDDSYYSSEEVEWWYWTGHLKTADGRWFGFEHVFFTIDAGFVGRYKMVHHAVTDIQDEEFHYTSSYLSGGYTYVENGFELAIGAQTAEGGDGHDIIHGEVDDYVLDLELNSIKAPVLQFGDGYEYFSQISIYTYYYSRERMEAAGTLVTDGETLPVTGTAWFDHQWGSHNNSMIDWDWFSIQLDDNREIMLSTIRNAGEPIVKGSYTDQNCITTEIDPADLTITELGSWTSPHSGGVYPMGWDVTISNISRGDCAEDLNFTITPVMEDQELTVEVSPITFIYWEGAAVVSGNVEGRAYIELNGYAAGGCSMSPSPAPPTIGLAIWFLPLMGVMFLRVISRSRAKQSL